MTTNAPVSHLEESLKMEADGDIDLFEIRLRGLSTIFRFWNGPTRQWGGHTWEGLACQLTGEGDGSENQARPKLVVVNPDKIFGPFAAEGYLDLAEVIRRRVLQENFINNVNLFEQRIWLVGRVAGNTDQGLQLELRNSTDMPAWKTPRRTFSPPEFPFVVIG